MSDADNRTARGESPSASGSRAGEAHFRPDSSDHPTVAPVGAGTVNRAAPDKGQPSAIDPLDLNPRYVDLGLLGIGGMGEVRRVLDRRLQRTLAMKILHADILTPDEARRFLLEAQVTSQLQHPSIVPLHDLGQRDDGRLFFTMKEVRGRTLDDIIDEVHHVAAQSSADDIGSEGGWRDTPSGWTFRKMVGAFQRVCECVDYAHTRGVLHRDLKPQNIMAGDYGEVLVLDWGLTRIGLDPGADPASEPAIGPPRRAGQTQAGIVAGTPGYMSPEQASGDPTRVGKASDMYGLGATLYHLLTGFAPYGDMEPGAVWSRTTAPTALPERVKNDPRGPIVPKELRIICEQAMSVEPEARQSAGQMAQQVSAWLEGAQRRAQAMELLAQARRLKPEIDALRREARTAGGEAAAMLLQIPPFAPVEFKRPAWQKQDAARELTIDADMKTIRLTQLLRAALTQASDLDAAHAMLADIYQEQHAEAEARRDWPEARRLDLMLAEHDRGAWFAYRRGEGSLDLATSPPGASLSLYRYEEQSRLLVPRLVGELGVTPVANVPLPMGTYLVVIRLAGHHDVRYPVYIERQHRWSGSRDGSDRSLAVRLPRLGELGPEDCYVPAGWFWSGGDPIAANSLPARRLWLDGYVMRKFPVTVEEYLAFLNDLLDRGFEDQAVAYAPPAPAWEEGRQGDTERGVERDAQGRFWYGGPSEELRWPVTMINWESAAAYAAWVAGREGLAWRLPAEMEHEKALRGVDARFFPWGDSFDPTFCKMRHSSGDAGRARKATVDSFASDESPYEIRGLSGNVHAWCLDAYQALGPRVADHVPLVSDGSDIDGPGRGGAHRIVRGGSWRDSDPNLRGAYRDAPPANYRDTVLGCRLARPFPTQPVM